MDMFTATTATTKGEPPPTMDQILASMELLLRDPLPLEPLGEFMRSKGMPPELGYIFVLPESMRGELMFPPRYVRFSPSTAAPFIFLRPELVAPL
ncbi:hypothetical protein FHT32_004748 [Variovorax sp. SG517]|uniref:hypothetical protein n=1 Tax=Variovorax sp. SG517 TaxID=2587117 RepID=UPI00159CF851|nr:hypothetical protein [Variovorax sp. SG517]NVM91084.1 hypothetical protein [Variovorax sp. SG517]